MDVQHPHEMDLPGELQLAIGDCGEPGNRPPGWPYPSFDAMHWVEEFAKQHPEIDQGEMIGWFSNALMAGYDHANRQSAAPDLLKAFDWFVADVEFGLRCNTSPVECLASIERIIPAARQLIDDGSLFSRAKTWPLAIVAAALRARSAATL